LRTHQGKCTYSDSGGGTPGARQACALLIERMLVGEIVETLTAQKLSDGDRSTEYPDIGKRRLADEEHIAAVGRSGQGYRRNGAAGKRLVERGRRHHRQRSANALSSCRIALPRWLKSFLRSGASSAAVSPSSSIQKCGS